MIEMEKTDRVIPKVLCIIMKGNRLLVHAAGPGMKFYRPPGGHIELFETSKEALEREFMEEFNSKLKNIRLLGVMENIFENYNGGKSKVKLHEYDFVYIAEFAKKEYYKADKVNYTDNGLLKVSIWMSLAEIRKEGSKLVPDGIEKYVKEARIPNKKERIAYRRSVYSKVVNEVAQAFVNANPQNIKLLDAGCGTGLVSRIFKRSNPKIKLTGVDKDKTDLNNAIKQAKQQSLDISYVQGDLTKLQFSNNSFDGVVMGLVLFHFPVALQIQMLKEIHRVLKKGGILVGIEPTSMKNVSKTLKNCGFIENSFFDAEGHVVYVGKR